jgi:aspartate carbamoyltransferase catalytic subunit
MAPALRGAGRDQMARLPKCDVVSIEDLALADIERIFALADRFADALAKGERLDIAQGLIMATLFYEPSTRTRLSFESAMHRLGGSVVSSPDMHASSVAKGESLADTVRVVSAYADLIVLRHRHDGAPRVAAAYAPCPIVNAGDGTREHPTQTLSDLYILRRRKGHLKGLTVALCGDLKYGRTVHSLIFALARFGANIVAVPTGGMEVPDYVLARVRAESNYSFASVSMDELKSLAGGLDALYLTPSKPHQMALFTSDMPLDKLPVGRPPKALDAFYVTRLQKERLEEKGGGAQAYVRFDASALATKRTHEAVVMHPLPRITELPYELDTDPRAVYFEQAAVGVPVRMALIAWLLEQGAGARRAPAALLPAVQFKAETAPRCPNPNCVTRFEGPYLRPRFTLARATAQRALMLRCDFCDRELAVEVVGHTRTRRYYRFDESLAGYAHDWIEEGSLAVFDSVKEAEEAGYEPYRRGPQREIMDAGEIAQALDTLAGQIVEDLPDLSGLVLVGIVSHGALLALRLRELIQTRAGVKPACAMLDLFGGPEAIRPVEGEEGEFSAEDRTLVLVDDVISGGWTVQRAMDMLWRKGRPAAVRLAVLIDRGHRSVPIRPNYVGKNVPTARNERVQVRLAVADAEGRHKLQDRVTIYSVVQPMKEPQEVR